MKTQQRGVALLEALIAILILGIGVLGTIGLQGRAYSALSDASMRSEATMACEKLLGVMTNDQANLVSYALATGGTPSAWVAPWVAETQARIPGAKITVEVATVGSSRQVDIDIQWTRKAGDKRNQHHVTSWISAS